jgi:hypothetical protein
MLGIDVSLDRTKVGELGSDRAPWPKCGEMRSTYFCPLPHPTGLVAREFDLPCRHRQHERPQHGSGSE